MRPTILRRLGVVTGTVAVTAGLLTGSPVSPVAHADVIWAPTEIGGGIHRDIVHLPALAVPQGKLYIPPKVGPGDADFKGRADIAVVAQFHLNAARNILSIHLEMIAEEYPSPDYTTADGAADFVIYQAPRDWCIGNPPSSVSTFASEHYVDLDHQLDFLLPDPPFPGFPPDFVQTWLANGDTDGPEAGTKTGVAIQTRPFDFEIYRCAISPDPQH